MTRRRGVKHQLREEELKRLYDAKVAEEGEVAKVVKYTGKYCPECGAQSPLFFSTGCVKIYLCSREGCSIRFKESV